jgi:hypothetical protein
MPMAIMTTYSPFEASRPWPAGSSRTFSTTTPPLRRAFSAICFSGALTATRTMFAPTSPVDLGPNLVHATKNTVFTR